MHELMEVPPRITTAPVATSPTIQTYQLLPSLSESEYSALKADIAARGVMVPVEKDEHGNTLDGFHREQICRELGISDYPVTIRGFTSEDEKIHHAIAMNLDRRHLSAEQRRELVVTLKQSRGWSNPMIADIIGVDEITVRRDLESTSTNVEVDLPERTIGKDGKSRPAQYKPRTVTAKSPQQAAQVLTALDVTGWEGEESTLTADELIKESRRTINHINLEQQRRDIEERCKTLPQGKYACIVIDPPWPMEKIEREERPNQVGFDYPTMDYEQLLNFDVPSFAADDCHLYMWTTHKHLPFSLQLAEAWGFEYQCLMTWVKNVGFTPFSWMYSTEHVLFCRRGSLPLQRLGRRLDFAAPVREHSRKPENFYDLVRECSLEPRIDIFSREVRDGFDSWGHDAAKF